MCIWLAEKYAPKTLLPHHNCYCKKCLFAIYIYVHNFLHVYDIYTYCKFYAPKVKLGKWNKMPKGTIQYTVHVCWLYNKNIVSCQKFHIENISPSFLIPYSSTWHTLSLTFMFIVLPFSIIYELITKTKCRHLNKLTCKGTVRQVYHS